jgi:hypothetical protein
MLTAYTRDGAAILADDFHVCGFCGRPSRLFIQRDGSTKCLACAEPPPDSVLQWNEVAHVQAV